MMFVTSSTTNSKKVSANDEGELLWIKLSELGGLKLFEDIKPFIEHILEMDPDKLFIGTSRFDGNDKLMSFDTMVV